ncbi:MAG: hypothetical protein HY457_00145 [Parcubacteria group bacterium]|nr:hypothetical protein [Parcubacteria group bacterium]
MTEQKHWLLFPNGVADGVHLRQCAVKEVEKSTLMRACRDGDLQSVRALLIGFWPFVYEFEKAIDIQARRLPLRRILTEHLGLTTAQQYFVSRAKILRQMHEEEGEHAQIWRGDALKIGADLESLPKAHEKLPLMEALIATAYADDPFKFFCALAATEYIAEELSRFLCASSVFTSCFGGRFGWGDTHIAVHDGLSHLQIDEDFAAAVHPAKDRKQIAQAMEREILAVQDLFGRASEEVFMLRRDA